MTDDLMSRIINVDAFIHLMEFAVGHCGDLSMEPVLLLLNGCPNLTMVGHLNSLSGIPKEDVLALKKFVQIQNLSFAL